MLFKISQTRTDSTSIVEGSINTPAQKAHRHADVVCDALSSRRRRLARRRGCCGSSSKLKGQPERKRRQGHEKPTGRLQQDVSSRWCRDVKGNSIQILSRILDWGRCLKRHWDRRRCFLSWPLPWIKILCGKTANVKTQAIAVIKIPVSKSRDPAKSYQALLCVTRPIRFEETVLKDHSFRHKESPIESHYKCAGLD